MVVDGYSGLTVVPMTRIKAVLHPRRGGVTSIRVAKRLVAAALAVAATAALGMTAPAVARTPVTTKGLAPMAACMTPHQAWVWEKALLSVPAVVLIPPHLCP